MSKEKLTGAAIIRGGKLEQRGLKSHYELRAALGDPLPQTSNLNDTEGFVTTTGRFVTRHEARAIGIDAGQLHPSWRTAHRDLLSSDINW